MPRWMIVVAGLLAAGPATACEVLEPFDLADVGGADLVLVGTVTEYRDLGTAWSAALITVMVEDVLKGRARGEVTFIWTGGMAQGPDASLATGRVLIGAKKGGRIAVTDRTPDARPDLPSIIQPYCGEVWMRPASGATVRAAREALE